MLEIFQQLPYFKDLLVAFFTGAANTWEQFTSEFAEGGLIDEVTAEERDLAWLPATNDENEGALGSFWQLMSQQPQLTLLNHNALAMFYKNNTQAFMAANSQNQRTTNICACLPTSLKKRKNNNKKGLLSSVIFTKQKRQYRRRNMTRLQEIRQSGWQVWHCSLTKKRS